MNNLFLFITLFIFVPICFAEEFNVNKPHGIEFGSSRKDAIKVIQSNNKIILENEKDSKKVRRIIFDGSLIDPNIKNSNRFETRLEFFNKKLMSSALHFRFNTALELYDAREQYLNFINENIGHATSSEKMLSYELWTWNITNYKILLNSNIRKNSLKIEYIYEPILNKKIAKELDSKRSNPKIHDPAKEMFLEGKYSRPKF